MTRDEIWIWFAAGALSQFQSGAVAATVADSLLKEFEDRFIERIVGANADSPGETVWVKKEGHRAWVS